MVGWQPDELTAEAVEMFLESGEEEGHWKAMAEECYELLCASVKLKGYLRKANLETGEIHMTIN